MNVNIICGDALTELKKLPDESVQCVVTSPPYFNLRDYGVDGQIGLEETHEEYIAKLVDVFRETRRVLRDDGTLWINIGDSYAGGGGFSIRSPSTTDSKSGQYGLQGALKEGGVKPQGKIKAKDLIGIPWRLAFALQEDGWYLRSDIIWHKPNAMPESVTDRPTKAHEYIFLLSKSRVYFYDHEAIKEKSTDKQTIGGRSSLKATDHITQGGDQGYDGHRTRVGLMNMKTSGKAYPMCNKRSVWSIPFEGYGEAHFATFPAKLVEPCILAGTSGKGCCSECGTSWKRVTEKVLLKEYEYREIGIPGEGDQRGRRVGSMGESQYIPVGWEKSCKCDTSKDPVPSVVLDPFCGSAMVGIVATRHNRTFIGIELNPEYVDMALRRIEDDAPLTNVLNAPRNDSLKGLPLFEDLEETA